MKIFNKLSENNRNVIMNILGACIVKGLALIVSLFTTPAYIRFFNNEDTLGVWFTILSVLTWILTFDLGIGNGLRNHLTRTLTEKDEQNSKRYISSAYISIGIMCLAIGVIFLCVSPFIPWNSVFNIQNDIVSSKALNTTVIIVFIGILLQLFFKIISSVLYAMQKSSVNNFLSLITSIIQVVTVYIIPSFNNDRNIITMAIVHALAVIVPLIVATVIVFLKRDMRKVFPSFRAFSKKHTKEVLSLGGSFLFVQLAYMVIMSTNEYLILQFTTSANVVDYQIYHRLFTLCSTIFALAMTPIWSAVTKAITEHNVAWVKKLYKNLMLLTILGCIVEFAMVPCLQFIVNLWLGDEAIVVNYWSGLYFAAFGSVMVLNSVLSGIANGLGRLKCQAISFSIGAVVKIPLSWGLVLLMNSWVGVIVATVLVMLPFCVSQPIVLQKFFKKKERGENGTDE